MEPIGLIKTPADSFNTVRNYDSERCTDLSPIRVDKSFEYIDFWS